MDDGICAIMIDSLGIICQNEVIEINSTWQALYTQFKNEKR